MVVFSLEVTRETVCWPGKWNVKKRKSVGRRSIHRKYVSWSRLQKRGTKFKWGRSFKHWPRGSPGRLVPETECLLASAIFVSGTSGITLILNYSSVSPIKRRTELYELNWRIITSTYLLTNETGTVIPDAKNVFLQEYSNVKFSWYKRVFF